MSLTLLRGRCVFNGFSVEVGGGVWYVCSVAFFERLAVVVVLSYALAGLPVGAAVLAGRMSPMYRLPGGVMLRWWGWGAVGICLCAWGQAVLV